MAALTTEETAQLNAASTEDEWNDVCDAVKKARDGDYPPDWYAKVIVGGVMADFTQRAGL